MEKLIICAFVVFCLAKVCLAPAYIECEPDGNCVRAFGHFSDDVNKFVANVDSTEKCPLRPSTKKSTDTEPSSGVPQSDRLTQLTSILALIQVVVGIGLNVAHFVMKRKCSITKNKYITKTHFHGNVTFISNPNIERQEESEDEEESDE